MSEDTKWKMLPWPPTDEMLVLAHHLIDWCRNDQNTYLPEDESQTIVVLDGVVIGHAGTTCKQDLEDAYAAMWKAAPTPPAPEVNSMEPALFIDPSDLPLSYEAAHIYVTASPFDGNTLPLYLSPTEQLTQLQIRLDFAEAIIAGNNVLVRENELCQSEVERLRGERDELLALVKRYRKETPVGHQPHMICHIVDETIAKIERK
jgi:hypothetical protein